MDIDGAVQNKALKFRELVYSVETGEAEMIGVDFVARGGGNATAVDGSAAAVPKATAESSKVEEEKGKKTRGKQKEKEKAKEETIDESAVLTAEDDERKLQCHGISHAELTGVSPLHTHREDERDPYA